MTSSKFSIVIFNLFILFQVFEGVVKYIITSIGISYLIYIPKLLLILAISVYGLSILKSRKINTNHLLLIILFGYSFLVGIVFVGKINQVAFGLYAWLPFIFGFIVADQITISSKNLLFYKFLFVSAFVGLVLSSALDLPWEGFSYETFGRQNEGSRAWNQLDLIRPAGFSIISWAVASHLAIFGIIIIPHASTLGKIIYSLMMIIGIIISTTKGVVIALAILCFIVGVNSIFRYLKINLRIYKYALNALLLVVIIFPFTVLFIDYEFPDITTLTGLLIFSFFLRLSDAWPRFFEIISETGSIAFGKGLGSFGMASYREITSFSHAVDSFSLYLVGTFGIIGSIFFISMILKFINKDITTGGKQLEIYLMILFLSYGLIVTGIEFGLWGIFFGLIINRKKPLYSLEYGS